ncbi:hypothetical protein PHJA_000555000 [Phtheirospermum japonicum]|uniref:Uncharacterized protein n=1 Tax=Phtheirospermum japonicum TaxID=374723 RepID=A0A830BH78_9LAMI|nr:hypothetical protein PHJA_000555000 [Phtheirospermum japonicum]
MLRAKRGFSWVPCAEKSSDLKSPTSVLENEAVENPRAEELGFFRGVQIVDENGFFMGDFSKLDDLSICADEHGVILA